MYVNGTINMADPTCYILNNIVQRKNNKKKNRNLEYMNEASTLLLSINTSMQKDVVSETHEQKLNKKV